MRSPDTNLQGLVVEDGQSPEASFQSHPGTTGAGAISRLLRPMARPADQWSRLDCAGMMTAVHYKALLDVLGKDTFNSVIAAAGLSIVGFNYKPDARPHPLVDAKLFHRVLIPHDAAEPTKYLLPGDRVYFVNHKHMRTCDAANVLLGEHALYVGNGKFAGFGVGGTRSYDSLREELLVALQAACKSMGEAKDTNKTAKEDKAVTEATTFTIDDIGGLNHGPVDIGVKKVEESLCIGSARTRQVVGLTNGGVGGEVAG